MSNNINSSEIIGMAATTFKQHLLSFIFLTAFVVMLSYVVGYSISSEDLDSLSVYSLIFILILIVGAIIKQVIAVHRITLLSENVIASFFKFRINDLKFILFMTALTIFFGLILGGMYYLVQGQNSTTFMVVAFPVIVGIGLVSSRLSLLFPALAIGKPFDIKGIWKAGENHKATLFFIVVVFPYFTGRLLNKIPEDIWYLELLSLMVSTLVMIFEVILVSHCYEQYHTKTVQTKVIDDQLDVNITP